MTKLLKNPKTRIFLRLGMSATKWLIGLIFVVAFFIRFYKIPELFFFGIDEEYQTLLAWEQVKNFHPIWIGLSAANTGYYIGPGLVYLHALLLWFSKGDPVIYGYFSSLVGIITLVILYQLVKQLFNKKTALISTALYGLSPFVIYYDRRFWNSTFVPLTAILIFFSLVKAKADSRWLILTAFLIASSFHIHASLFIFIPIIVIILFSKIIKKINHPTIIVSALIYLTTTLPLLIYDIVHNFDNLKTPFRMLSKIGQGRGWSFPEMAVVFFGIVVVWFFISTESKAHKVLKTITVFYILFFVFYPGPVLEYYYLGFLPFFSIILSLFLHRINGRILTLLLIIYTGFALISVYRWPTDGGLAVKKSIIKKASHIIGKRDFYLITNRNYLYFGGWRYLFQVYGKKPIGSQADTMFGWIYSNEINNSKPELRIIIADQELDIIKPLAVIHEGTYYAYIIKE